MNFNSNMLMHWSKLMSSTLAAFLAAGTAAWLMFGAEQEPAVAAIAMTYSIIIPYFLGMATQVVVIVKGMFTCLERVLEYLVLPQEPEWHLPSDSTDQLSTWPNTGAIEFQSVS